MRCPRKKLLKPSYPSKKGWFYKSKTQDCRKCSLRYRCLSPRVGRRTVHLAEGYEALTRARRKKGRWTKDWKDIYKRHRWQVEGIHGEAKTQHGLDRAVRHGRWNVGVQAFLTAIAINLKRLVLLWRWILGLSNQRIILIDIWRKSLVLQNQRYVQYL